MERIVKRKCICCGKEYEYCYHCGGKKNDTWKNNYDVESCRDVFNIITDYRGKYITKEEATEKLKELNLVNRATYVDGIAEFVDELIGAEKAPIKLEISLDPVEPKFEEAVKAVVENAEETEKKVEEKPEEKPEEKSEEKHNQSTVKTYENKNNFKKNGFYTNKKSFKD